MPPRSAPPPRPARSRSRTPRPRVRLDNDQRRAQLLGLAKAAFSEHSYDEVSIDDIARQARISKGLLYHYFPTKRDLYVAGLTEIANDLMAAITSVPDSAAPIDRVRLGLDAYLEHVAQHARAFVSLMRGGIGSDPEIALVVESVRARLFDRFVAGSPLAPAIAGNALLETAIRGWLGFVEAASIDWCANPRLSRFELRELLTQVLFEVLRVAGPGLTGAAGPAGAGGPGTPAASLIPGAGTR